MTKAFAAAIACAGILLAGDAGAQGDVPTAAAQARGEAGTSSPGAAVKPAKEEGPTNSATTDPAGAADSTGPTPEKGSQRGHLDQ
jgi:hypothetical protein